MYIRLSGTVPKASAPPGDSSLPPDQVRGWDSPLASVQKMDR